MQKPDIRRTFEEAYDAHIDAIFRFFSARLNDRERAKELAQETFMRAWKYAASGRDIRHMRAFLYTIAGNLFKNELRARRETVSLDTLMEDSHYEPVDAGAGTDAEAERVMLLQHIHRLKPEHQEVLMLRYVDDLDIADIARALDITPTTASVRIYRAVQKLRTFYNPAS